MKFEIKDGGVKLLTIGDYDIEVKTSNIEKASEFDAVFVHGMLGNETVWEPLIAELQGFKTASFRLPWSGEQGTYWGKHGDGAFWLQEAMNALDARPKILVAHSFGCLATLDYLLRHQNKQPEYLVLIAPFYKEQRDTIGWDTLDVLVSGLGKLISESVSNADTGRRYEGDIKELMTARLKDKLGVYGWVEFLKSFMAAPDLNLGDIRSKTLLIGGMRDQYCPVEDIKLMASKIADCQLNMLPSGGHFPMQTQTQQVLHSIHHLIAI